MGGRIRSTDWSSTPLGPVASWPANLRGAVGMLLASKAQIVLFYGPDLVAIYNDAYAPVLGSKHPWALGRPARECWSEIWDDVLGPLFDGVVRSGEAYHAKDHPFFLERSGYLEETYFDVSYDPLRNEAGGVDGVFCIVSDTTGKVLGDRRTRTIRDLAVRTANARTTAEVLATVAETLAPCGHDLPFTLSYVVDAAGAPRLASATGLSLDAPAARPNAWPLAEILRGGETVVLDLGEARGPLRCGPYPEEPRTAVVLPIKPAGYGEAQAVLVAGVSPRLALNEAYRDFHGLLAQGIGVALADARTHEEERRRAEALAELDRAKTTFFQNVSHELRTPLALILGPLEELLEMRHGVLPMSASRPLSMVRRNALRLRKLVDTLLDFARVEAGRAEATFRPTDLAALTADLASNFRSACDRAGLRLTVDAGPVTEPVFVDRAMWEKIVLNLVSNAFKFTLKGEIEVRLDDVGSAVELTVRDTGSGIPEEHLPHVFDRFHRVEGAPARSVEGSGIGLALVRQLVQMHGGTVGVRSVWGGGTTFTVTVPKGSAHLPAERVQAGAAAGTSLLPERYVEEALAWLPDEDGTPEAAGPSRPSWPAPASARPKGDRKPRILLADDNADMRTYLERLLGRWYAVESVADGRSALFAARRDPPDLVLADVMMPQMDGLTLLASVRSDAKMRATPFVLLSARAGEEARAEGLAAGADDYLVKPFAARELLVRVAAALGAARRRATATPS